ncbi:MAG: hypothetical protein ACKVUS_08395 [Saprospiraceae bacterium]
MRLLNLLLFFPIILAAQSDFLKKPDVVWATLIEQDWEVDNLPLESSSDFGVTTIKLLQTEKTKKYPSPITLSTLVFDAATSGSLPIFKDPGCTTPTDWHGLFKLSDNHAVNPETGEIADASEVIFGQQPFLIRAWRLRQVLAYHKKSATWSTTVESIAPLMKVLNREGDSIGIRPLFWFRPDNKRQKLSSNRIVWAKKTRNKQPNTQVPTNPKLIVKLEDGFQFPLAHSFRVFSTEMKTPFYDVLNEKILSPDERRNLISKTDTVATFDPETYEEKVFTVQNDLDPLDVRQLMLIQTWYWDERRARLSICLDAVGPMIDIMSSEGNFRFSRPLFYRRAKGR